MRERSWKRSRKWGEMLCPNWAKEREKEKNYLTNGVGVRLEYAHGASEEVGLCLNGPATAGRDDAASSKGRSGGGVPQWCHGQQRRS